MRSRKIPAISAQEQEYRHQLLKKWAQYRHEEVLKDYKILDRVVSAQKKALNELRFESEELYQQAIQHDLDMVPMTLTGPVETPPIANYNFIDGDYINTTKIYDGEEPEK